jgi:predicted transcriptional regulator
MAKVTSVRLSDELAGQLDRLAASVDRPRAWLIEQAIARYVEEEAWQIAAITEALDEYRQGKASVRPHDEVMRRMEAKMRGPTDDFRLGRHHKLGGA